jgi:hypothetical protein
MSHVQVMVDGGGAFSEDAEAGKLVQCEQIIRIAGAAPTAFNKFPIVAIALTDAAGKVYLSQTSLEVLLNAADMLKERYGDPRVNITRH